MTSAQPALTATPIRKRIVDALRSGSFITLDYGVARLITPTPEMASVTGDLERTERIRRDVFEAMRPHLVSDVENPRDDYSRIIYKLPETQTCPECGGVMRMTDIDFGDGLDSRGKQTVMMCGDCEFSPTADTAATEGSDGADGDAAQPTTTSTPATAYEIYVVKLCRFSPRYYTADEVTAFLNRQRISPENYNIYPSTGGVIVGTDWLETVAALTVAQPADDHASGSDGADGDAGAANLLAPDVTVHEAPAFDALPVTILSIARTLRSHGIHPDTVQQTRNGDFSIKFATGQSRYWANRVLKALPDAALVSRGDGAVCVVVVRV